MKQETAVRWNEADFESLEEVLRTRAGLSFSKSRRGGVEVAAARVMRRLHVSDPRSFVTLVAQDGAVFDDVMAEVTVGETYFLRDPAQFTVLRDTILPAYRQTAVAGRRFRAWSAGCASGEEPYSIAITLREQQIAAEVLGTDVSRARLARARRGRYGNWSLRGVPAAVTSTYFAPDGNEFVLDPAIRRSVEFRYLNLAVDAFPSIGNGVWGMDLILCRNVLIYFDQATIQRVAASLIATLSDNGWLLVGATDPPIHDYTDCEVVQTPSGLAYRRPSATAVQRPRPPARAPVAVPLPAPPAVRHERVAQPEILHAALHAPLATPDTLPSSPHNEKAAALYAARNYEDVVTRLTSGATTGTLAPDEWVIYIRSLANLGRLDAAGRACAAALDRFNEHAELHYLHAILIGQAGQHAESARAAKRAVYLDRSLIVAHLALGTALVRGREYARAQRVFATAERLLGEMRSEAIVPASDGEPAARLLEMTRLQARLASQGAAA
jgi:chemotaxis protein methyltransferase CheR